MVDVTDNEYTSWKVNYKVIWEPKLFEVCWAHNNPYFGLSNHPHWSRKFEYPWILNKGDFQPEMKVLDAAGGKGELSVQIADKGCDVICADMDQQSLDSFTHPKVIKYHGRIEHTPYKNGEFDRVVCSSVLEHCSEPLKIISELWRLLNKGGKLLITMDVSSNRRHNHTIDEETAKNIVYYLNPPTPELPECPSNMLINVFPEIDPQPWEHPNVLLRVLCFAKVKI